YYYFFFQAEDGIRYFHVTGVQTCALPISALFDRYPTPKDLAGAVPTELEELIHSTGFYRNKARSLLGMAQRLVEAYDGEVPRARSEERRGGKECRNGGGQGRNQNKCELTE